MNTGYIDRVTIRQKMESNLEERPEIRKRLHELKRVAAEKKRDYKKARHIEHMKWIDSKRPATNAAHIVAGIIADKEYEWELTEIDVSEAQDELIDARQDGIMYQSLNKTYEE